MDETYISIPLSDLVDWAKTLDEGLNPMVEFNHDSTKMLADAYQKRFEAIVSVGQRIHNILPPS